jgi:hypothetical protein
MKRAALILTGVATLTALACDRSPTDPSAPAAAAVAVFDYAAAGHLVEGSGHVWGSAPGDEQRPGLRKFTISVREAPDGTVSGHYNLVTAGGLHIEGVPTCLTVAGDRAFIGGTFRNAQPPAPFTPVGVAIEVVDGGSGPGAIDQIGPLGIFAAELGATPADVQAYCDDAVPGPVSPTDLGEIRVR